MVSRTGTADLPLHSGSVPPWLATRMAVLGRVIAEAIIEEYGRDEMLRRLAHPFWFQSFGAVMGMDWHSSGITTSVVGALKRGLAPIQHELGLYVCGGRGRHSRRTPAELLKVGEQTGLDAESLARTSRLVAKVDSAAVQDGYELYLHAFVVSREGKWCVVQQGMSEARSEARRYHWLSDNAGSFLDSPHAAIVGRNRGTIVNLADARAAANRRAELEILREGPVRPLAILKQLRRFSPQNPRHPARARAQKALSLFPDLESELESPPELLLPHLQMPAHHEVLASDVVLRRLHGVLAAASARGPEDFPELLLTPGVGARTVAALALVAEIIHGTPSRFSDPARFSLAHGGKDGHPFPVPLSVYDQTIRVLKDAVQRAKLGNSDRAHAIRRLDTESRRLEKLAAGPSFQEFVESERRQSTALDGRTVYS